MVLDADGEELRSVALVDFDHGGAGVRSGPTSVHPWPMSNTWPGPGADVASSSTNCGRIGAGGAWLQAWVLTELGFKKQAGPWLAAGRISAWTASVSVDASQVRLRTMYPGPKAWTGRSRGFAQWSG